MQPIFFSDNYCYEALNFCQHMMDIAYQLKHIEILQTHVKGTVLEEKKLIPQAIF